MTSELDTTNPGQHDGQKTSELDNGASPIRDMEARPVRNDVRERRVAKGLSQADLAQRLDVSRQTINSIETDRYTPSLPLAIAIARFFGVTVEEIFHANHN